jgi:hypothetical protein
MAIDEKGIANPNGVSIGIGNGVGGGVGGGGGAAIVDGSGLNGSGLPSSAAAAPAHGVAAGGPAPIPFTCRADSTAGIITLLSTLMIEKDQVTPNESASRARTRFSSELSCVRVRWWCSAQRCRCSVRVSSSALRRAKH